MDPKLTSTLDEVAARALPASEVEDFGGWVARHSPGLAAKRANSVWPREHAPGRTLEAKLAGIERFYAARGLPARFQISPAAEPPGLDRVLDRRGYREGAPTSVELCALVALAGRSPRPPGAADIAIETAPTAGWLATWQACLGLSDGRVAAAAELFARLPHQVAFVTVSIDRAPGGVALGALDGRWLGIFNMATAPSARRRGVARAALGALAGWGRRSGAQVGYLQVDLDNEPARAVYQDAGFESAYHYAYRTLAP